METSANGKTILIADDDEALRRMYRFKLTKEGFRLLEAADGEEGLRMALERHPDLILLDVKMPKLDGMTVMKKLRDDAWGRQVPIIIISNSDSSDEALREIRRDEPAFYLLKPNYSLQDVVDKIRAVLA
jgi:DNA-binding response OmpR family regulator